MENILRRLAELGRGQRRHASPPRISAPIERPLQRQAPRTTTERPLRFEDAFTAAALGEAFRKVRANGGGPGPDAQSLEVFERRLEDNLHALERELRSGRYRPQPALRVWLPKSGGEPGERRPIAILNVRDRVAQRAAHTALAPFYESRFHDCSFGFRESRGVREAVAEVVRLRDRGMHYVVDGDIRRCFESMEHDVLLRLLERDIGDARYSAVIERWLRMGVLSGRGAQGEVERQERGVGQGAAISPLLSNVYLHQFDEAILQQRRSLVRYADDWVILCRTREDAEQALDEARAALESIRLTLNPHKTRITDFASGWAFLGAFFVRDEQYWVK